MASSQNHIVLVPGIMGSELSVAGLVVWAGDRRGIRSIVNPSLLLPWLSAEAGKPLESHYDSVQEFLERKGYRRNIDLFLFGYDWRRGIQYAAEDLGLFVDQTVRKDSNKPIVFL